MAFLPVHRLGAEGRPSLDPVLAFPCLQLRVTARTATPNPRGAGAILTGLRSLWGLIDTGADNTIIDLHALEDFGPELGSGISEGAGGAVITTFHAVTIVLENGQVLETYVSRASLATPSRPFHMLLGRNFLQFCRFRYDAGGGVCDFEFIPPPKTSRLG